MHIINPPQPTVASCIRVRVRTTVGSSRGNVEAGSTCARPNFMATASSRRGLPNAPLTLADEAAPAIPALEKAGGAHVVGHSYGGAVALKLATMRPRLVRSIVVYERCCFVWYLMASRANHSAQEAGGCGLDAQNCSPPATQTRQRGSSLISGRAPAHGTRCHPASRHRSPRGCMCCCSALQRAVA